MPGTIVTGHFANLADRHIRAIMKKLLSMAYSKSLAVGSYFSQTANNMNAAAASALLGVLPILILAIMYYV